MGEVADAYAGTRERMTALLRDADPTVVVPACPAWTVKDVAAHMAGVVDDVLAGRLDGVGSDPWTDAQVEARADRSMDELVRALTGRRSHNQIRGFEWNVDPEAYLPAFEFGPFCPPPTDVVETNV